MNSNPIFLEEADKVSNFVLSQLFKDFKSPNADLFVFDNVNVLLDLSSTTTSTFIGDLRMTGLLAPFKKLLGSSDTLTVTTSLETAVGLTEKISPNKLTFSGIAPFHVPLFSGVTLTNVTLQVVMSKEAGSWSFTPTLIGILDVDGITDANEGKIKLQVSLDNGTLKLSAEGKNITGAFGLSQLVLDEISIDGAIGAKKELAIATKFEVGTTTFDFEGVITPTAVGMIAKAQGFTLNKLANIFVEISPGNLKLPDFDVTFKNTSIAFASADCTVGGKKLKKGLSLKTELKAHGYTVSAEADITHDCVAFSGSVGNIKVDPVNIKEAGLKFEIYTRASDKPSLFTIYGKAEIQNVTVYAGVYFEKQVGSWITVLYATVSNMSLSTFFPQTKGSVMDQLELSKMSFVVASADCTPQMLPDVKSVKKGLQLIAVVKEIPGLNALTGQNNMDLELTAHIGDTVDISVALPDTRLRLGNSVTTEPFKIALFIAPTPSIALIFGLEVSIPNQELPLHFDMMLDISPIEATGSATMKNYWYYPFGINGLKIGPEVAMQLGINYFQFAASGTPSSFALAGGLAIGNTIMAMAVSISTNPMDEILSGSLQEIDLKEIVVFSTDTVGLNIPEDNIPDFLDLKNIELYVAPTGGNIGTITYEKGISFACDMVFMGKEFQFYTRISENGIEGAGKLDAIKIGPLKVSGERGDDVSVGLALTPSDQSFSLDGAISFLGSKSAAFIDVSNKGIEFKFEENFYNQLTFQIEGKSSGSISNPSKLDFQLSADMQNNITRFLKDDISYKIKNALDAATEGIDAAHKKLNDAKRIYEAEYNKAQKALNNAQDKADAYLKKLKADVDQANANYKREVDKAENKLKKDKAAYDKAFDDAKNKLTKTKNDCNSAIANAEAAVEKAERVYESGIASAEKAVTNAEKNYNDSFKKAQNDVDSWQSKVNSLKADIDSIKRKIKKLKWNEKLKAIPLGVKLAGLEAAHFSATVTLDGFKIALDVVKKGGSFMTFQSLQIALLSAKTGANLTNLTVVRGSLLAAKTAADIAIDKSKATLALVQYGTEYTAWQAAEQALNTAKVVGNAAINSANQAVNMVGSSTVYLSLNAAKVGLTVVEASSSAVNFGIAKAALQAAKAGSNNVLRLAAYIAHHSGDIFDVKSMHISGSFKKIEEEGGLFKAKLKVNVLGVSHNWDMDLNIKDVQSFLDKLFEMALSEAKIITQIGYNFSE